MSLAEIFTKAITNTILGMGVVFSVLIFIAFIISLFKYLPGLIDRFHKKTTFKIKSVVEELEIICEVPETIDAGITVAIITAAVQAAINEREPVGDAYFVRAIRRV